MMQLFGKRTFQILEFRLQIDYLTDVISRYDGQTIVYMIFSRDCKLSNASKIQTTTNSHCEICRTLQLLFDLAHVSVMIVVIQ